MSNRVLYILSGIFILLLVVVTEPIWSTRISLPAISDQPSSTVSLPSKIDKVTFMAGSENEVVLEKQGSEWLVNQQLADQVQVQNFLADMKNVNFDNIVSSNPDNFKTYGATDSAQKILYQSAEGDSLELIVGERNQQIGNVYLKPLNEEAVYQTSIDFYEYLFRTEEQWRDKLIVDVSEEDLNSLQLSRNGQRLNLEKNDEGQWQALLNGENRVLGEVAQDRLFEQFQPLEGSGIASQDQRQLFNDSSAQSLELVTSDETINISLVEDVDNSVWLISTEESEEVFTIKPSSYSVIFDTTFSLYE